jgi:hypothetical protein
MTNQVPGILGIYFANAILLTVVASTILVFWYRRTVARGMRRTSGLAVGDAQTHEFPPATTGLGGRTIIPRPETLRAIHDAAPLRLRLAVIYGVAGLAAAAVLTILSLFGLGSEFRAIRVFAVCYTFCWPIIPTLAPLLVIPLRRTLLAFIGYVFAGVVIISIWSAVSHYLLHRTSASPYENAISFLELLALYGWLPFLIICITSNRRLRSIVPLVLAGLLVFSFSNLLVQTAFIAAFDYPSVRQTLLRLDGRLIYALWMLIAALPVGYACWLGLRWLSGRFERKAFSDAQLLVDAWWLIIVFHQTAIVSSDFGWGGLLGLLAFVAYRLVVALGLAAWSTRSPGNRRLLLLRVFGFQRRTERLFDSVGQRWRFTGSVNMIAGADLAMRTIYPRDLISFVSGRLRRSFVLRTEDLAERVQQLDERRDPDGRFRLNNVFCYEDTWRSALTALLGKSDLVLMDLRSFSASNSGCIFELRQLVENALLSRTIFVVDDTTDVKLLESTLSDENRQVVQDDDAARLRITTEFVKSHSTSDLNRVYNALYELPA